MATGRVPTTANSPLTAKGDLFTYSTAPARLAVGSNGDTIVADSSTSTGLRYTANFAAGKNKIINGDFGIWQRGTSFSTNGNYTADRYQMSFSGTSTAQTVSQQTFTLGTAPVAGYEGQYFCRNVVTAGTGTGSLVVLTQKIEDVRTFAGQTVTVSFWAKAASGTPSIGLDLYQEFGSGGSDTVSNGGTKVTISTSWARYSATIALASISGKTIGTNSLLAARLWFSSGSDYNSLNGSLGLQSGTFDIWGFQIEAGSVATAFQTATGTIQGELAACQRYYYENTKQANRGFCMGQAYSTTQGVCTFTYPVTMRSTPTISLSAAADFDLFSSTATRLAVTAFTAQDITNENFQAILTVASGLTAGNGTGLASDSGGAAAIKVSAEL